MRSPPSPSSAYKRPRLRRAARARSKTVPGVHWARQGESMNSQPVGGLAPAYETYRRQKCFVGYSERAEWTPDLLAACQEVLAEHGLELDCATRNFAAAAPLRQKALELVANARYGIY